MFSELFNFIFIIFLVIIQSIAGVGVLVLGTPTLLLLNVPMIEIMNYLLPISIITSLLNLMIIRSSNSFTYDYRRLIFFFLICIPFIFIGLIFLKYFYKYINFDYLVSIIILFTLFLRQRIAKSLEKLSIKINIIFLMIVGFIHGLTNSGGSLLSIFLAIINKSKNKSRNEITLYYFLLALMQFILLYFIFDLNKKFSNFYLEFFCICVGIFLGNIFIRFTSESQFRKLIFILGFLSSVSLILKNIF